MAEALPDFEDYVRRGQIEIIPHTEWYLKHGTFDSDRVLGDWVSKLEKAQASGFAGLRLSGNTFWLEAKDWRAFTDYEAAVDGVIGRYRMLAVCTYSIDRCGFNEILDVIRNHRFALVRREGTLGAHRERGAPAGRGGALARSREWLSVTLASIGDAVIATDAEKRILFLNPVASTLTGWSVRGRARPSGRRGLPDRQRKYAGAGRGHLRPGAGRTADRGPGQRHLASGQGRPRGADRGQRLAHHRLRRRLWRAWFWSFTTSPPSDRRSGPFARANSATGAFSTI